MDFETMKIAYHKTAFTPAHALGFIYHKHVYLMLTSEPVSWKLGKASQNRGNCLRFQPDKDDKFEWVWEGKAVKWMTLTDFYAADSYPNDGHRFEHLLALQNGQDGKPNDRRYWKEPDLLIDGKPYQAKFQGGSVSETSIASALEELGL